MVTGRKRLPSTIDRGALGKSYLPLAAHAQDQSSAASFFDVGIENEVCLIDDGPEQSLWCQIYYPKRAASTSDTTAISGTSGISYLGESKAPIIIFSHGAGATGKTYGALLSFWAANGFICLSPTHADSLELQAKLGRKSNLVEEIRKMPGDRRGWVRRAKDISATIDNLKSVLLRLPESACQADFENIAVAGHSYGAFSALMVSGAEIDFWGDSRLLSLRDERISSCLVMSGPGVGEIGLLSESFLDMHLPVMVIAGSKDKGMRGHNPLWRTQSYELMPAGDKYLALIASCGHHSFARQDVPFEIARTKRLAIQAHYLLLDDKHAINPRFIAHLHPDISGHDDSVGFGFAEEKPALDQNLILGFIQSLSIAFWNAYLKHESGSSLYLRESRLTAFSDDYVRIICK